MIYRFYCHKEQKEITISASYKEYEKIKVCPDCGSTEIDRVWGSVNSVWHTSGGYSKQNHKE